MALYLNALPSHSTSALSRGVAAQDSTLAALTPEQLVDLRIAHAKHTLHLLDLQASQMRTILLAHESTLQSDRKSLESTSPGTPERKAARQKLIEDTRGMNAELKPILNAHQMAKWRKILIRELRHREIELRRRQGSLHR